MLCCYFCAVILFFLRPHCNFSFEIIKFALPYLDAASRRTESTTHYQSPIHHAKSPSVIIVIDHVVIILNQPAQSIVFVIGHPKLSSVTIIIVIGHPKLSSVTIITVISYIVIVIDRNHSYHPSL